MNEEEKKAREEARAAKAEEEKKAKEQEAAKEAERVAAMDDLGKIQYASDFAQEEILKRIQDSVLQVKRLTKA